jgi:DNA-binding response OmpR family regulator
MIIIVEERPEVSSAYRNTIGREGYSVAAFNAQEFLDWFHSTSEIDLSAVEGIVLGDCGAADVLARDIRFKGNVPAIALSESHILETTLKLFAAGVDDVVRKPVHAKEIIARLGVIRRRQAAASTLLWSADGLEIHGDGRDPTVHGKAFVLPRREKRILEYLAASKNRRVTRSQIFATIYGLHDEDVEECVVESHISKLRKKLKAALGYDPIDTQRFLGYQLVPASARKAA